MKRCAIRLVNQHALFACALQDAYRCCGPICACAVDPNLFVMWKLICPLLELVERNVTRSHDMRRPAFTVSPNVEYEMLSIIEHGCNIIKGHTLGAGPADLRAWIDHRRSWAIDANAH